jgi:hypothetical protein
VLFLSVTSLVVPESSGLSSPVRDSWESTPHECVELLFVVLEGRGRRTTKAAVDGGMALSPRGWCAILTFTGMFKDFEGRGGGQIRVSMSLGVGGAATIILSEC